MSTLKIMCRKNEQNFLVISGKMLIFQIETYFERRKDLIILKHVIHCHSEYEPYPGFLYELYNFIFTSCFFIEMLGIKPRATYKLRQMFYTELHSLFHI